MTVKEIGMRILIDGLDLSGKTTLVDAVLEVLAVRGVPAVRHRGMLAEHHPFERLLKRLPLAHQADSGGITAAYLFAGFALDATLSRIDPPHTDGAVLIQEGYVDRTVAVGLAGGPYLPAALALWAARGFATFDLAVFLHASLEVRRERMQYRDRVDAGDRRSVVDEGFAMRFNTALLHYLGRRHRNLLTFDTGQFSPQEIAEQILTTAGVVPGSVPASGISTVPDWPAAA
jgi:thymidylate kinase